MFSRRSFLQVMSLLPLVSFPKSRPTVLEVHFIALDSESIWDFVEKQKQWVDTSALRMVSQEMKDLGQICHFDAQTIKNKRVLRISFRSHFDYQVFRLRMKKKMDRTYLQQAKVQIEKFLDGQKIQG